MRACFPGEFTNEFRNKKEVEMQFRNIAASAAALAVAMSAAPAFAQDDRPYFDGVYIGGSVTGDVAEDSRNDGFVFDTDGDGSFDDTVRTVAGADAFSPGFCSGSNPTATRVGCDDNGADIGYAARIGFDKRFGNGPIVGGLLIEGSKPGVEEFTTAFSTTPASYTIGREIDWTVGARARLGISPGDGRGLFYATGGVGYARIDHSFATTNGANSFTPVNDRSWELGWQAGGGAELMLTRNIGLGLEYLYSNYDGGDYAVAVGAGTAPPTNPFLIENGGTDLRLSDTDFDYHSLRASLNFRF